MRVESPSPRSLCSLMSTCRKCWLLPRTTRARRGALQCGLPFRACLLHTPPSPFLRALLVPTISNTQPSPAASTRFGGPIDFVVGPHEGGDSSFSPGVRSGGGGAAAPPLVSTAEMDYFDSDDLDDLGPMVGPPAPSPAADAGRLVVLQPPGSALYARDESGARAAQSSPNASPVAASPVRDPFAFDDDDAPVAGPAPAAPSVPTRPPLAAASLPVAPHTSPGADAAPSTFDAFSFAPLAPAEPDLPGFRASPLLPIAGAVARRTKLAVVLKSATLPTTASSSSAAAAAPPESKESPLPGATPRGGGGGNVAAPSSPPSPPRAAKPPARASLVDYGDDDLDDTSTSAASVGVPVPSGWTEVSAEPAA